MCRYSQAAIQQENSCNNRLFINKHQTVVCICTQKKYIDAESGSFALHSKYDFTNNADGAVCKCLLNRSYIDCLHTRRSRQLNDKLFNEKYYCTFMYVCMCLYIYTRMCVCVQNSFYSSEVNIHTYMYSKL